MLARNHRPAMILVPTVRLARRHEAGLIAEMSREYIEHGLGWSWTRERVLRAIADASTNVAVAHEGGRVLGFGIMQYGEYKAHLSLLGVDAVHRNRGLATLLLDWLETSAGVAGVDCIRLEARRDNALALAFYEKHGYRVTSRVPGYYRGVVDAIRLEKKLGRSAAP
jgi:[ribosomal protein S18]-alanine N-acetyltransferase